MHWLYLHFPNLLLDHLMQGVDQPGPMALSSGGRDNRLVQANRQARALGVRPGQALNAALALCPDLHVHTDRPALATSLLDGIAHQVYTLVAWLSLAPPDGLLLDTRGMARLHGGLGHLPERLNEALHNLGYGLTWSFGDTPLRARLLAQTAQALPHDTPTDTLRACYSRLPLSQLALDSEQHTTLQRLGVYTLGDLLNMPIPAVAQRLSPGLADYLLRLEGRRPDLHQAWQPSARFRLRQELLHECVHSPALLFPLQRMLQRLTDFLRQHQRHTDRLALTLEHRDQPPTRLQLRSTQPQIRAEDWLPLARLRLERLHLPAPVIALHLQAERLLDTQQSAPTPDLFADTLTGAQALATLLDRLQARLGDQQLQTPFLQADYRPERGTGRRLPKASTSLKSSDPPRPVTPPPEQPVWLLEAPQPLHLPANSQPRQGPLRIQCGWWDGRPVQRDYYRLTLDDGREAWCFRTARDGWFLHGWFG